MEYRMDEVIASELKKYKKQLPAFYNDEMKLIRYPDNRVLQCMVLKDIVLTFSDNRNYTYQELAQTIRNKILFNEKDLVNEMMKYGFLWQANSKYRIDNRWKDHYNKFLGTK